jgi:nitroreductase
MNETIKTILSRRSVRGYKPDMPGADALAEIMKCAVYAPSGMNTQSWHFTVIKNADLISRINAAARDKMDDAGKARMTERNNGDPDFSLFYFAPVVVIVSAPEGDGGLNAAVAMENICRAAEALGLGSCMIGLAMTAFEGPKGKDFIKEMKIPDGYRPVCTVAVGYKAMEMPDPGRMTNKVDYIE